MRERIDDQLSQLKSIQQTLQHSLELAEARVLTMNRLITQLAATRLLHPQIYFGGIILTRAYDAQHGDGSSGEVVQAALSSTHGIGCLSWDSEDFAALQASQEAHRMAEAHFVPFDRCAPALRALLLPQLESLLEQLLQAYSLP